LGSQDWYIGIQQLYLDNTGRTLSGLFSKHCCISTNQFFVNY
jgi:hypothetical protein